MCGEPHWERQSLIGRGAGGWGLQRSPPTHLSEQTLEGSTSVTRTKGFFPQAAMCPFRALDQTWPWDSASEGDRAFHRGSGDSKAGAREENSSQREGLLEAAWGYPLGVQRAGEGLGHRETSGDRRKLGKATYARALHFTTC